MRAPLLVALGILAAGCVAPAPDDAASEDAPVAATLTRCLQQHLSFPARADDFADRVPAGWQLVVTAGGATMVLIKAHRCEEATEAWVEIPVTPPSDLDADAPHSLVLDGFTTSDALAARYAEWGFGDLVERADVQLAETSYLTMVRVKADRGNYEWSTVLRGSSGDFAAETMTRWIGGPDGVTGRVLLEAEPSTNRGVGAAHFTYSGGDAAPPIADGIAHEVVGLAFRQTYTEVPS